MSRTGPIVIVDDDKDDHDILLDVFGSLKIPNQVRLFTHAADALKYLRTTHENPFIIFSDINLPFMNGMEFRREINNDVYLRRKSIPFIFLTTSPDPSNIDESYELMVQGFFIKRDTFDEIRSTMQMVMKYWLDCLHPNNR
jgi:CheY-like chemotaxis protein